MYAATEHAFVHAENSLSGLDPLIASLKQKVVPPFSAYAVVLAMAMTF